MRIETCKCLKTNTNAELSIFTDDEVLHVPFKVTRIIKENNFYSAMGVEVLQQTSEYLEFVNTLEPSR